MRNRDKGSSGARENAELFGIGTRRIRTGPALSFVQVGNVAEASSVNPGGPLGSNARRFRKRWRGTDLRGSTHRGLLVPSLALHESTERLWTLPSLAAVEAGGFVEPGSCSPPRVPRKYEISLRAALFLVEVEATPQQQKRSMDASLDGSPVFGHQDLVGAANRGKTIAIPKLARPCISVSDSESRLHVASSRIRMRGSARIARAIETRGFWPPGSCTSRSPTNVLCSFRILQRTDSPPQFGRQPGFPLPELRRHQPDGLFRRETHEFKSFRLYPDHGSLCRGAGSHLQRHIKAACVESL